MDWHSTEKLRNGRDPRGNAKELYNEDMKRKGKAKSSTTKQQSKRGAPNRLALKRKGVAKRRLAAEWQNNETKCERTAWRCSVLQCNGMAKL